MRSKCIVCFAASHSVPPPSQDIFFYVWNLRAFALSSIDRIAYDSYSMKQKEEVTPVVSAHTVGIESPRQQARKQSFASCSAGSSQVSLHPLLLTVIKLLDHGEIQRRSLLDLCSWPPPLVVVPEAPVVRGRVGRSQLQVLHQSGQFWEHQPHLENQVFSNHR